MRTELIKKFCKQNASILKEMGIEWHEEMPNEVMYKCTCGFKTNSFSRDSHICLLKHIKEYNPTFQHPEEVLAVCMKWDDVLDFVWELNGKQRYSDCTKINNVIPVDYIITKDKLLEAAVEWRE